MEKVSGVYAITHIVSGRVYIGSSKDMLGRWAGHQKYLQSNIHHNARLQNAWNKYGSDQFHFGILERCHESVRVQREQFWIDQASASLTGIPHSNDRKANISKSIMAMSQEARSLRAFKAWKTKRAKMEVASGK
jgi:group I intron endonuclease